MITDAAGRRWWLTAEAAEQLRVDPARFRDWVRRSRLSGHVPGAAPRDCPRCRDHPDLFPHVDPPVREGRLAAYLAEQLMEAEAYTGLSTRTGKIRQGA